MIQISFDEAKLRYWSFWPARRVRNLNEIPKKMGNQPRDTECVFFFGSKNFGYVRSENVLDYKSNRMKYVKKGRGKLFNEAVTQMDEFISDPIAFYSNGYLNPMNAEIVVKSERTTAIKTEMDIEENPYETEKFYSHATNTHIENLKKEKEQIIKDLVRIKSENQKLIFQLQLKSRQLKSESSSTVSSLTAEVDQLKQQLECEKSKNRKSVTAINELHREKNMLSAQIDGLQSSFQLHQNEKKNNNKDNNNKDEDDDVEDEFEVENILDHRVYKRYRKFLVSWKGYSSDENRWISEKNLHCPNILIPYLKKHGLSPPNSQ